jgi:peptidoglycan-associated lipoprotein
MSKLAIGLICIFFAACSTSKNTVSQANSTSPSSTPAVSAVNATSTQSTTTVSDALSASETASADKINTSSIYFDYDKFEIKSEFRKTLENEVEYLKAHPKAVITLEGNADERGSSAFNLALGDKRASAVQKSLELMGVPAAQLKVISLGETNPKASCHEEKCWHENRRVDFNFHG